MGGVDYFDVFLAHNINETFYPLAENNGTFEYVVKMKEEGLAKKIGIIFHDKDDFLEKYSHLRN